MCVQLRSLLPSFFFFCVFVCVRRRGGSCLVRIHSLRPSKPTTKQQKQVPHLVKERKCVCKKRQSGDCISPASEKERRRRVEVHTHCNFLPPGAGTCRRRRLTNKISFRGRSLKRWRRRPRMEKGKEKIPPFFFFFFSHDDDITRSFLSLLFPAPDIPPSKFARKVGPFDDERGMRPCVLCHGWVHTHSSSTHISYDGRERESMHGKKGGPREGEI